MNDNGAFVAGIIFGVVVTVFVTTLIFRQSWEGWAIENNYAHYDPKTGKIVYEPLTETLIKESE